MGQYYRIKEIPGLEGLLVRVSQTQMSIDDGHGVFDVLSVDEIVNPKVSVGDQTLRWPQEYGRLFINRHNLEPTELIPREWTTDSPFGEFVLEGHYRSGKICVDYAQYRNGISVSVRDEGVKPARTVYTQNYFDDFVVDAMEAITGALRDRDKIEELVFDLKDIAASQQDRLSPVALAEPEKE